MEINEATRLIAGSLVSELIRKKKTNRKGSVTSDSSAVGEAPEAGSVDVVDINFGELETYYKNVVSIIENTPEIRQSIVQTLKGLKEQGKDLNELYPSMAIAQEQTLRQILFLSDV